MQTHGYYVGADEDMKGQHALLRARGARVEAQFDALVSGLGYGWHPYPPEDFFIYAAGIGASGRFDIFDVRVRRAYTNGLALEYDLRRPGLTISPRGG